MSTLCFADCEWRIAKSVTCVRSAWKKKSLRNYNATFFLIYIYIYIYMYMYVYIITEISARCFSFICIYAIEFIANKRSSSRLVMSYLYKSLMLSIRGNDCIAKNARQIFVFSRNVLKKRAFTLNCQRYNIIFFFLNYH